MGRWLPLSCLVLLGALAVATVGTGRGRAQPPQGFTLERIAMVPGAREIAAAPNGDLLVGTSGRELYLVPQAEASTGPPSVFLRIDDSPVAGVTLGEGFLFIGSQFGVWRVPYQPGDARPRAEPLKIAAERTNGESSDHRTTTVAYGGGKLWVSVGSSCNACDPELDATRATVQEMNPDGSGRVTKALHIRNAIALGVNPGTGTLWAGVAGQDELPHGHPYEIFDPVSLHPGTVDYGWPHCYDDRRPARGHRDCSHMTVARIVLPAYSTPIGVAFYPAEPSGKFAFPAAYWGGAFVTLHGSWHVPLVAPRVVFVPMHGDTPAQAIDWSNPDLQWSSFLTGFQSGMRRSGRPTGIAVGPEGSLFVADDDAGVVYRVRPPR